MATVAALSAAVSQNIVAISNNDSRMTSLLTAAGDNPVPDEIVAAISASTSQLDAGAQAPAA